MTQKINNIHPGVEQTLRGLIEMYGEMPTRIIIPKIQRDYAQGRKGKGKLRESFLKDLFEVIDTDQSSPRRYDYIYGRLEDEVHSKSYHFYPVDGQQRLTTMFLLHLYIGKRALKDTDFLKHFSYQTRNSSKLFCELVCSTDPKGFEDIISYIKDHHRFTSHWENDPTISSMMQMLEDIDKYFNGRQPAYGEEDFARCWDNLVKNVRFWMLDLADLDTTDDIYIKMNSRGKGLTPFENFKAELDTLVAETSKGFDKGEFAMKIDTTWTNLFWNYRNTDYDWTETDFEKPEKPDYTDNGLDDKMLNFFRNYLTIEGLKNDSLKSSKMADSLPDIELAERVAKRSPEVFADIRTILDFFCGLQRKSLSIAAWFETFLTGTPEESRFASNPEDTTVRINPNPLAKKTTPTDYLALLMGSEVTTTIKIFAYGLFYLILNRPETFDHITHSDADFEKLRILRNLIVNSELHDDDNYHQGAMQQNLAAVDVLMSSGLEALKSHKNEFSGVQIEQEIDKSRWLAGASNADQVAIKQLENHSALRGNLKQLYGLSPLSLDKINNFRRLFRLDANYDEIEQVALSFGDYAIRNGDARNYAERSYSGWKDRIFVSNNACSIPMFEVMLNRPETSYQDYVDHKNSFLAHAQSTRAFDWPYYLCKYSSMRWAPRGCYLLAGERYLYYMFRASTSIHSDTYIHYNVYNDALFSLLGSDITAEDNRGGALTVLSTGAKVDVSERTINIELIDGSRYHVEIPENDGIDLVDRVQLGKDIVDRLRLIATPADDDAAELKTLVASALDSQDWPELIKDTTADTDNPELSAENETTLEL